jgi:hypothetical protein
VADNNILIIPKSGSIQFTGSNASAIRLQVEPDGNVAFYGSSGSILEITPDQTVEVDGSLIVTGSIFSNNSITATSFTGSLNGTVTSASFATTASFADFAATAGAGFEREVRSDFVNPYSYIGVAPVGSLESAAVWTITRIDIGPPVVTTTATNIEWDSRLTASYT